MNAAILLILPGFLIAAESTAEPRTRTFRFSYDATVTGLELGKPVRIWVPVPSTSNDQRIEMVEQSLPGPSRLASELRSGNRILFVEAQANSDGAVPIKLVYQVSRREVRVDSSRASRQDAERFLKPDNLVPAEGKHFKLLDGRKFPADPLETARALYDLVNGELCYSKKGTGWGQGDVNWVCDNKYGNCTDFHSLFIALARARKIPGKFEIGFPLPATRGRGDIAGYHCWAKFLVDDKGWIPVDISMANQNAKLKDYCFGNLTEDRVAFSEGRDINLMPKQDGPPLNFFVYPYVEVSGKAWPADKIVKRFAYEDVPAK